MQQLPFEIPESLASYAEHFETEPLKATTRLKKQLNKRGADAVGHFLLAWFYHLKGMDEQAVDEALRARVFAPGSPFFEKLHYYLSHPKTFEAWQPPKILSKSTENGVSTPAGSILNLDTLIQKLSEVESEPPYATGKFETNSNSENDIETNNVDDIASETIAHIHEKQGKTDAAIRTYKRLKDLNKEKSEYYNTQISRLQELRNQSKD